MRLDPNFAFALGVALLALVASEPAPAAVQFFVDDLPGFNAAIAGDVPMGIENWSSAGNAGQAVVNAPLLPGVPNGPFPQGTNVATGLTVRPNAGGANGSVVTAGGVLFFAPAGFAGVSGAVQATNQLSANANADSLDLLFEDVGEDVPSSISLSPMFYRTTAAANAGTIEVEVYDGANALVGSTTVTNVIDVSESSFLGIVGNPGEIRRVNLWAGGNAVAGADNIRVLTLPEPASGAAIALLALTALQRMRRNARH